MFNFINAEDLKDLNEKFNVKLNLKFKIELHNRDERQTQLLVQSKEDTSRYTWVLGNKHYIESQYIAPGTKFIGTGIFTDKMFPHVKATPGECTSDTLYDFDLPNNIEDYINSLGRKNRSNFRKYLKDTKLLEFRHISYKDLPDLIEWHKDSVKNPENQYNDEYIKSALALLNDDDWLILEVKYDNQILGYNIGFFENTDVIIYNDVHFFHKDANKWSSTIIAYLIQYCINRGINKYNLDYGCSYKRKFIPENQQVYNLSFNDEDIKPGIVHNYLNPTLIALSLNGESFWLRQVNHKQVTSPRVSEDTLNMLKNYYPFATNGSGILRPIVKQQTLASFYNNAKLAKGYLLGKYMINGYYNYYNELLVSEHMCRVPIRKIPTVEQLSEMLESISYPYYVNLIDSGVYYEKVYPNMYEVETCMLRVHQDVDTFINSFKSKRRKDIRNILDNLGTIEYTNLKEQDLYDYLDLCYQRFGDIYSILTLIFDISVNEEPTKILHYKSLDNEEALLSWVLVDNIWVYNGFFQLTNGRPIAKEAVIKSVLFINNETSNDLFDLTSFAGFGCEGNYNDYKKAISNETRLVYGFTVGRDNANLFPPYYNLDKKEWVL